MEATSTASTSGADAPFSPAAMMTAAWEKHLASRVKVSPWTSTRASGIGDLCERRIFYRRTKGALEKPYEPELQAIFDLGNHLETYVVRKIEEMGFEVVQRGKDWADSTLEITGHVDALISRPGWPRAVPTEIKGLNPFTAGTIETLADLRDHPSFWVRKYYDQLQTYLDFERKPLGLFALLDKSAGQIRFLDCPRDDVRIDALKAKAARIRDAVRANAEPPRTTATSECERCGFRHLCCPDIDYGDGPVILDNAEIADLLSRRAAVEAAGREFARLDKKVKELLPEAPTVIVGDFEVTARKQERASYVVPAGASWVRKIGRIGGTH